MKKIIIKKDRPGLSPIWEVYENEALVDYGVSLKVLKKAHPAAVMAGCCDAD